MSKQILLLENSAGQTSSTQQLLEGAGYQVKIASDYQDALVLAANYQHCLVLLGLDRPYSSGFEICKRLKNNLNTRLAPVIIFSKDSSLKVMMDAYMCGADYYVVKDEEGEQVLPLLIDSIFRRIVNRMIIETAGVNNRDLTEFSIRTL